MILKLKPNAYNSIADKIRNNYFGGIKWHHDNPDCSKAVYQVELFSNGCISLKVLENRLAKICKQDKEDVVSMLSEFYTYEPKTPPYVERVFQLFKKLGVEKVDLQKLADSLKISQTHLVSRRKEVVMKKALLFVSHLRWGDKKLATLTRDFGFNHSTFLHHLRKLENAANGFDKELKNFAMLHLEFAQCD